MLSIEQDPEAFGVFLASVAWMNSGGDHEEAAAVFGSGYPEYAVCFS